MSLFLIGFFKEPVFCEVCLELNVSFVGIISSSSSLGGKGGLTRVGMTVVVFSGADGIDAICSAIGGSGSMMTELSSLGIDGLDGNLIFKFERIDSN